MSKFIKAAVLGHPVKHSKSPLIHNYWIKKYGLNGSYEAIDIMPQDFEKDVKRLIDEGYSGFNCTVPHKEAALRLCDEIDDTARTTGAVNTIYIKDGVIKGTNTDAFGYIENIRENARGFDFSGGPALVLGAGGAARAIIYGLLNAGTPKIILTNRTREKAENLAIDPRISVIDWHNKEEVLEEVHLLTNTTVLGMDGKPALEIDIKALPKTALINDIVYAPLYTPLLQDGSAQGNPIVTGIGMLLHQARPAFAKWFEEMPAVDHDLERMVLS